MFKINNKNSKRQGRRSGVFIVNFEHVLLFPRVSIDEFEQVHVIWLVITLLRYRTLEKSWPRICICKNVQY